MDTTTQASTATSTAPQASTTPRAGTDPETNQKALDAIEAMVRDVLSCPAGDTFLDTEGFEFALTVENLCEAILAAMGKE